MWGLPCPEDCFLTTLTWNSFQRESQCSFNHLSIFLGKKIQVCQFCCTCRNITLLHCLEFNLYSVYTKGLLFNIFLHTLVQFRIIAVHPNLTPVDTGTVTIFLIDGRGNIMRRWFQLQLINGTISLLPFSWVKRFISFVILRLFDLNVFLSFQGLVELEYKMTHPIRYNYFTIRVEGWVRK